MSGLLDSLFHLTFASVFLLAFWYIYKGHQFLHRLIDEGKVEGPSTGELQSEMIGWFLE